MDKIARFPAAERAALFGETGAGRGVANTIIEKDFWVCWTLRRIFALPKGPTASLVFKGGTSLSKAFNAIRRFSEDIDLSFDRAELGYAGDRNPEQEGLGKNKAAKLIEHLIRDVETHIAIAPVKLRHIAGCKEQWHKGLRARSPARFNLPPPHMTLNAVIGASIPFGLNKFKQPADSGIRVLEGQGWRSMARPAARFRRMEFCVPAVSPLG